MIRTKRQARILELINQKDIETQLDLTKELINDGFKVTQATVSRDIKDLGLVKTASSNKYKYVYPEQNIQQSRYLALFKQAVISIDIAMNIIVLKTVVGSANSACMAIDKLNDSTIVGTLAGDDTIIVIVKAIENVKSIYNKLKEMMTGK